MVKYPITVGRIGYRGNNPSRRMKIAYQNEIAAKLESAINELLLKQEQPIQSYLYHEISSITGYSVEQVRELCFSIDCGHNGFTAIRHDLSYEEASKEMHNQSSSKG